MENRFFLHLCEYRLLLYYSQMLIWSLKGGLSRKRSRPLSIRNFFARSHICLLASFLFFVDRSANIGMPCTSMSLPTRLGCRRRRYNPTTCNVCHVENRLLLTTTTYPLMLSVSPAPTTGVNDTLTHATVYRQRLPLTRHRHTAHPCYALLHFPHPPPAGNAPLAMPSWAHNRPTRPCTDSTWYPPHRRHRRPSLAE
jgi:hypothetical protein